MRECGCPAFVVRCAHFDGLHVNLIDRRGLPMSVQSEWLRLSDRRYFVSGSQNEYDDFDAAMRDFEETALTLPFVETGS